MTKLRKGHHFHPFLPILPLPTWKTFTLSDDAGGVFPVNISVWVANVSRTPWWELWGCVRWMIKCVIVPGDLCERISQEVAGHLVCLLGLMNKLPASLGGHASTKECKYAGNEIVLSTCRWPCEWRWPKRSVPARLLSRDHGGHARLITINQASCDRGA